MANKFQPINPNSDMASIVNQINQNFAMLDAEVVTKTFRNGKGDTGLITGRLPNELGTGTLLYGLDGKALISMRVDEDGEPSLRVAKAGYDATTASDDQLAFNSAQNTLKVVQTGTIMLPEVTYSKAGTNEYGSYNGGGSNVVAHNLGYRPAILAFIDDSSTFVQLPWTETYGVSANSYAMSMRRVSVDDTNVYGIANVLTYNRSGTISARRVKYYLLQETAD